MKGETRPRAKSYRSDNYLFITPARTFQSLDWEEKRRVLTAYNRSIPGGMDTITHRLCIASYICGDGIALPHKHTT